MINSVTLFEVSAFSGLAGAVLTQTLTGMLAYLADRRKDKTKSRNLFRSKRIEIAEKFYYVTGETMTVVKKSMDHLKERQKVRSEASMNVVNQEIKKLDGYLEKLNTENWQQNLIGLYFNIALSYDRLIAANSRSHGLYLQLLDARAQIKSAEEAELENWYGKYHLTLFDLYGQYEDIYRLLEADMAKVKKELLNSFK